MKHALVTGGAGFIGSHISFALVKRGYKVTILDNLSSGKKENIQPLLNSQKVTFLQGDVSDPLVVREAVKGVQVVFHEAAVGSVPKSIEDPLGSHIANVTGTLTLLIEAKKAGVQRFVNAASSSAYGETEELPKRETMAVDPLSPYAATKLAQENYCKAFAASYGLETVSLRYFNVFGPRQDPESQYAAVVPKFFAAFLQNRPPIIFGDGEQTRDFTFVGDVVEANLQASEISNPKGGVVNIAGGKQISVNQLAERIRLLVGTQQKPVYETARVGDVRHSLADITKAQKVLGWKPKTSLEEGLQICFYWYRENLPSV